MPERIKESRVEELMLAQQRNAFARNAERVGSELCCLVDSVDEQATGHGRFYGQAPEIDSICIIRQCSAKAGEFVKTRVVDSDGYDLVVEQI